MQKDDFFSDLQDIIDDPLTVSLAESVQKNMWTISITDNLLKEINRDEFTVFVNRVIENRKEQAARMKAALKFYAWFDRQTFQFRFSIIPQELPLPFRCEVSLVDLEAIVTQFLNCQYCDNLSNALPPDGVLHVYSCNL